jgi:hypothetical protein
MSQFGTWARNNLVQPSNTGYEFMPGITASDISEAISRLGSAPGTIEGNKLNIYEILLENRTRNMLSLYAELYNLAS